MSDSQTRIAQFQKMANDDPNNELGHFSLGQALLEAGRAAEAIPSLERTLAINPNHSRAHQRLGAALLAAGRRDEAVAKMQAGVVIAHDRGDKMPRDEMVAMLKDLGATVPELKSSAVEKPVGEGEVNCRRCGQVKAKLARAPFKREFGQQIYAHICHDCWQLAIRQGTKVINELRLPMNDPAANRIWEQHIREFLNLQD
jgi:Fe-S cluster biosynthesis and repair protein YggX